MGKEPPTKHHSHHAEACGHGHVVACLQVLPVGHGPSQIPTGHLDSGQTKAVT